MSNKRKVFSYFNPPPSPSLECKDASLTRQEYVQESDINNIMRKYSQGMPLTGPSTREPMYGDFSNLPDYQTAFEIIEHAQTAFDALPSDLRRRFQNDPGVLLDWLNDEANRDEAVKLGLVKAPVAKEPVNANVSVPDEKKKEEGAT